MIVATCGHRAAFTRRGLCRSCHRKLSENGDPLPPDRRSKPPVNPVAWLVTIIRLLPAVQQQALREALERTPGDRSNGA